MLQKINTVTVLGTVLLVSTVGLFVQKPELGLAASNSTKLASIYISDPSSEELFSEPKQEEAQTTVKMASAVEAISAQNEAKEEPEPTATSEAKSEAVVQVASIDAKGDNEVFVDTINSTLPAVFEDSAPTAPKANVDVLTLIRKYAAEYGVNAEVMIAIATCESGLNPSAISASGTYKGMYQFVTSTWQSNRQAMGLSDDPALMFNAEEAIKTAAFKMGRDGYGAWPVCSQKALGSLALK